MVPIHNNGVPKRPSCAEKAVWKYTHAHSQLPYVRVANCEHDAAKREIKAILKATEVAREAYNT